MTDEDHKLEWLKCSESPAYFIDTCCWVYDAIATEWLPFRLWAAQYRALTTIFNNPLVVILKARQIGMTWLALGYALWLILFRPAATVLLFSKRDDESIDLLDFRLKGMYQRLPARMQARAVTVDSKHEWVLSNGSRALGFPTSAGDSYTGTLAIADEFDLVIDQGKLISAVKPTISNGGQMILLSRPDKKRPLTPFKQIYRAAKQKANGWTAIFLPWSAHPGRDAAWYEAQRREILARTQSLDELYEQYPQTDAQALAPATLDKRIAPVWLEQCFAEIEPLLIVGEQEADDLPAGIPAIPGLIVWQFPQRGHRYVIGADPAEGNPTSDDSALTVLDRESGEEVASLAGKFQPSTLAAHADRIGSWYNRADVLVERNNHGHAVLLWLKDNSRLKRLAGHDRKEGWHSTTLGKTRLYDVAADTFRHGEAILHTFATLMQLQSIEGSTLRAPEGEMDDRADSCALACVARLIEPGRLSSGQVDWYAQGSTLSEEQPDERSAAEVEQMLREYEGQVMSNEVDQ